MSFRIRPNGRAAIVLGFAWVAACGDGDAGFDGPSTVAECGSSLSELTGSGADSAPAVTATYSAALANWTFDGDHCGVGLFAGECADGKRLLYRHGGYTSEIRYFDGENLVGYVGSGDVGVCPSVCPFSQFYGTTESVSCVDPVLQDLCPESSSVISSDDVWMPFANGRAPGGCD